MTKKVTLLFPGQGSQYVGMGKNLSDKKYFSIADEVLNYSLSKICFEGPDDELKLTMNTQPALLTHSISLFDSLLPILKEKKYEIDYVLGHSVGEYAALVAAQVISFKDAVKAVHLRGKYMQEAVPFGVGKMFAILRTNSEEVIKACQAVSNENQKVMPANFNEPSQIVISGHAEACDKVVKWLSEFAPKARAIELNVSAPFHSSLMLPAEIKLENFLNEIKFSENKFNYIANIDAKEYGIGTDPQFIKSNLVKQVSGSVLWSQSIEQLSKLSPESICLEVGPGKVLQGLVKKVNPEIKIISIDEDDILNKLNEVLI